MAAWRDQAAGERVPLSRPGLKANVLLPGLGDPSAVFPRGAVPGSAGERPPGGCPVGKAGAAGGRWMAVPGASRATPAGWDHGRPGRRCSSPAAAPWLHLRLEALAESRVPRSVPGWYLRPPGPGWIQAAGPWLPAWAAFQASTATICGGRDAWEEEPPASDEESLAPWAVMRRDRRGRNWPLRRQRLRMWCDMTLRSLLVRWLCLPHHP